MNRVEFQQLAEIRLREAEALLAAGLWDGAYYLAGYAVECGLKACIIRRVEQDGVIFDDDGRRFSDRCWTHVLEDLVDLSGLKARRDQEAPKNTTVHHSWIRVKDWKETSRYRRNSEVAARDMFAAVADPTSGVMQWIRKYW